MRYIKYIQIALLMIISFASGIYIKSSLTPAIGVVNLEQVLEHSAKFSSIKQNNEKKLKELAEWIDEVNKEIDEEKDSAKRLKLANQYRKLTHDKESFIRQEYGKNLQEINEEITSLIDSVAKQNDCNYVFANTSMVSGGKDITSDVIKAIK